MRRLVFAVFFLVIQSAEAQEDVGLVSFVAGDVLFQAGKAKGYMKVREGDRFDLPAGAQLRLVYFAGARQERWQGPASLRAGKRESAPLAGKPAEVSSCRRACRSASRAFPSWRRTRCSAGSGCAGRSRRRLAGAESEDSLREARATYARCAGRLPADDLTPELFLYAALAAGPEPRQRGGESLGGQAARTSTIVKRCSDSSFCA